jgi:hypothetical protein
MIHYVLIADVLNPKCRKSENEAIISMKTKGPKKAHRTRKGLPGGEILEWYQKPGLEERANETESITAELSNLYMMLETGKISEEEFAAEEKTLLDRLDKMPKRGRGLKEEHGGEEKRGQREHRRVACGVR